MGLTQVLKHDMMSKLLRANRVVLVDQISSDEQVGEVTEE